MSLILFVSDQPGMQGEIQTRRGKKEWKQENDSGLDFPTEAAPSILNSNFSFKEQPRSEYLFQIAEVH